MALKTPKSIADGGFVLLGDLLSIFAGRDFCAYGGTYNVLDFVFSLANSAHFASRRAPRHGVADDFWKIENKRVFSARVHGGNEGKWGNRKSSWHKNSSLCLNADSDEAILIGVASCVVDCVLTKCVTKVTVKMSASGGLITMQKSTFWTRHQERDYESLC